MALASLKAGAKVPVPSFERSFLYFNLLGVLRGHLL
jgi:hypothetical protein